MPSDPKYAPDEPFEELCRRAFLTIHDEVAVPEVVTEEWVWGSFRTGFLAALAMVGEDRKHRRGRVTRTAIVEAVEIVYGHRDAV